MYLLHMLFWCIRVLKIRIFVLNSTLIIREKYSKIIHFFLNKIKAFPWLSVTGGSKRRLPRPLYFLIYFFHLIFSYILFWIRRYLQPLKLDAETQKQKKTIKIFIIISLSPSSLFTHRSSSFFSSFLSFIHKLTSQAEIKFLSRKWHTTRTHLTETLRNRALQRKGETGEAQVGFFNGFKYSKPPLRPESRIFFFRVGSSPL